MKPPAKKNIYMPQVKTRKKSYNKVIELKPVDEVKALFRDYFRKNCTAGHIMSKEDVKNYVLRKLNAKEDSVFSKALNELQSGGFIEIQADGVSLMLTQEGANSFS